MSEIDYGKGERAALTSMLQHCLIGLGYEDTEAEKAKWVLEREAAVSTLRNVCGEFGDNDWDDGLYLSDVIEKHLAKHIRS
jgi:hypothetical protein